MPLILRILWIAMLLAPSALALAQTTNPAASAPASSPAAFGTIEPLPIAQTVQEGLQFTDLEKDMLAAVVDHSAKLDESGLFVMFRRAAAMPTLSKEQFRELDNISMQTIMAGPEKFRGQAMQLKIKVFAARKWTTPENLSPSRWWPRNRPVWLLTVVDLAHKPNQPLSVISLSDPAELLGKPDKIDDGEARYFDGRDLEMAALFYKVYRGTSRGNVQAGESPAAMDYPLFIAWQVRPVGVLEGDRGATQTTPLLLAGMVLIAVFLYLHRRNSRIKKQAPLHRMDRMRQAGIDEPPADDEDEPVDEALRAAVQQNKKGTTDGSDRTS